MALKVRETEAGVLEHSLAFFGIHDSEKDKEMFFYIPMCGRYYCTDKYYKRRISYPLQLIMHIMKGTMHCEYRGKAFDAIAGDVVLMDCTEPHYYGGEDGLVFQYVHYEGSNAREITRYLIDQYGAHIRRTGDTRVAKCIADILDFYNNGGVGTPFYTSLQVYNLLHTVSEINRNATDSDEVIAAIKYINENFRDPISLDELSEYVHLSKFYFAHKFKEVTGQSPTEYIIRTRINQAKSLLVQTNMSIDDIAYEVGYSSGNSFSNVFTAKEGCSPRAFRKIMK